MDDETSEHTESAPDVDKAEATEPESSGADESKDAAATEPPRLRRQITLNLRTVLVGGLIVALAASLAVMSWLYFGERNALQAELREEENHRRAEQMSLDYAVGAATMNFQDLNTWKAELVEGTSPQLQDKLAKAAESMEQILIPLEWNSTSKPLVAKVRTEEDGVYVVDTFVSVLTKTTQAPDNLQSTATYSITIDSNNDWLITDVGGIGAVAGAN